MSSSDFTEYTVKLGNVDKKEFNIMRYKHPHKIELDKLTNPKLERQELKQVEETAPDQKTEGDGSEYRQKEREEARRRKRGYRARKINPSDQPWILKEQGGKHFIGRKEGNINSNASYYVLSLGSNNSFEAYPISNWYNFLPPVKYNHLNDEEAEERFEKRHKTMNYFSIMVSKRIKEKDEEDSGFDMTTSSKQFKDSESEDEFSSVGSDTEDKERSKVKKKPKKVRVTKKKRKTSAAKNDDSEAGEETDEGDMESKEMDFYLTSSSEGEEERELKAVQEEPRDDAEVERKEEGGIDKVFEDETSSSDEGEDLTESGRQLKALIRRQTIDEKEEMSEEEEEEEKDDVEKEKEPESTPPKGKKREATDTSPSLPSSKKPKLATPTPVTIATTVEPTGPTHITKEEVCKYLSRKPMTAKALVKKFVKRKPEMNKSKITTRLAEILKSLPTEKQDKTFYLPNYNDNNIDVKEEDDDDED